MLPGDSLLEKRICAWSVLLAGIIYTRSTVKPSGRDRLPLLLRHTKPLPTGMRTENSVEIAGCISLMTRRTGSKPS